MSIEKKESHDDLLFDSLEEEIQDSFGGMDISIAPGVRAQITAEAESRGVELYVVIDEYRAVFMGIVSITETVDLESWEPDPSAKPH